MSYRREITCFSIFLGAESDKMNFKRESLSLKILKFPCGTKNRKPKL